MATEHQERMRQQKSSRTLLLIYVNIAIYATCFQIQRPLEPFLVEKLGLSGDSGGEYAKLQSFFSLMQTVGSLLAGTFLDKFGVKGGFIISFMASALSYFLLSNATTLNLLYLSKIPTVFQAGYLCAQLAASQATSDGADRVLALGRLSMSYTIGAILGPALGGFLGASGDYYLGAKISVAGSLLSVVLSLFLPANNINHNITQNNHNNGDIDINSNGDIIDEINDKNNDGNNRHIDSGDESPLFNTEKPEKFEKFEKFDIKNNRRNLNLTDTLKEENITNTFENLQIKSKKSFTLNGMMLSITQQANTVASVVRIVWLLLSVKIITGVANSMLSETFPLVLKNIFLLNEQSLGLAIAANSAFNGVVNGLFLAPLVGYANGDLIKVITLCLSLMTALALTLSAISLPYISPFHVFSQLLSSPVTILTSVTGSGSGGLSGYLLLTFILSIFTYALSTTITGESTSLVKKTQKGTLLGVEHSFFSLARIVAPQVGVWLLKSGGVSAVSAVSGGVYFSVLLLWNSFKLSLKMKSLKNSKINLNNDENIVT